MWYSIEPSSYRAVQTLTFHSVMVVHTFLTLFYERDKMEIKKIHRDFSVIVCMTVWAMIGSHAYTATTEGYSYYFNWFFVLRDPFYMIPENISIYIMPLLNIFLFFFVEFIFHLIFKALRPKKLK